jgi:hypothetical protein
MIPEKLLKSMEERYHTYGLPDGEVKRLIDEVRALQSEVSRLCPVADLGTVASLRAELQLCQEQVQALEAMLDKANEDAHRLADALAVSSWNTGEGKEALKLHRARYQTGEVTPTKDDIGIRVSVSFSAPGVDKLKSVMENGGMRFESNPDMMINLTRGWNAGINNPEHGGTYRVHSLKPGADVLDEKTCCFDIEVGWSTPDEVIEWKELN